MKVGIATRRIIPKWALVDPSLTISCPPHVTSHSGMDALSHAIESFCAKVPEGRSPHAIFVGKNPASDGFAKEAITLIVFIVTLYFLSNLPSIKAQAYRLVPRSRRARVGLLTDEILARLLALNLERAQGEVVGVSN